MPVERGMAHVLDPDAPLLYLPEGPVWDAPDGRLLWVEIASGRVFDARLDDGRLADRRDRQVDSTVGAVLLRDDDGIVVAGARHVHCLDAAGEVQRSVEVIDDATPARLNDATVDPSGRVLVGTAPLDGASIGSQRVAQIGHDGEMRTLLSGLNLANGMDFSADGGTLFVVDSIPGRILAMDYDATAGEVANVRTIWSGPEAPDGLTVDAADRLWVAFFGSGQVRCLDTAGAVLATLDLPAPHPTCPTFVGPQLDRLVVTTAREKLSDEQLHEWPLSGAIFVADVGAVGLPARRVRTAGLQ